MILDWQNVAVLLTVLAASFYVARRGWSRLRSFGLRKGEAPIDSLAPSCGSCAGNRKTKTAPTINVLVQIKRPRTTSRRAN